MGESSNSQQHFLELCDLLDEPRPEPGDADYCFEKSVQKTTGGKGRADVWRRHHFAWEYKGQHKNLDMAFDQLKQYAGALDNPPLLIVSDMKRIRIHTNWTNTPLKTYEFSINELTDIIRRNQLKWAMSDSKRLKPGITRQELTRQAADSFAQIAQRMRDHGHDPQKVAPFINRMVFCMFAEDTGLLPKDLFTKVLRTARQNPDRFSEMVSSLFEAMKTGGSFFYDDVDWFNGELFEDNLALPMDVGDIEITLKAAELDWAEIDPAIMGTLFERGLKLSKRTQLGTHYTDREKIMKIIDPVITRPLLQEWECVKAEMQACLEKGVNAKTSRTKRNWNRKAKELLDDFLEMLRGFTVLDPACGSGNFLYLALHSLKDIEHEVQLDAEKMGFQRQFPSVGPANLKGIEINSYAAELARVSIWIGEIQWMRNNGFGHPRDPILAPLKTIECRDAILNGDGTEPEWPDADVVIGNPPFLGGTRMRPILGDTYVDKLRKCYDFRIRGDADLVCYWFDKAYRLMAKGEIARAGLVATNSICGGHSRPVLDRILEEGVIYDAWSDEPWVVEGAAVRVSLVCFAPRKESSVLRLDGNPVSRVNADLTSRAIDLTMARKLHCNQDVAFKGDIKNGKFDIAGELAREWLQLPVNPNMRPNADVLKPWVNGKDMTSRPSGKWIIDFGFEMNEAEAALYEAPFTHIQEIVKPMRQNNRKKDRAIFWFRHVSPRAETWQKLKCLTRYIATPTVSKHRLFFWIDSRICPDQQLIFIARDDDTTFGILHSRFHEAWALGLATRLGQGNDPRYTPTTIFQTFPFPDGLTLDIPASQYADGHRSIAINEATENLVKLRDRWLNPPKWVEWVDEPVPCYPKRPVARSQEAEKELRERTLTNLYNIRPQWLLDAHADLNVAVAAAYGWPADIPIEDALAELLRMNLERSSEQQSEIHEEVMT